MRGLHARVPQAPMRTTRCERGVSLIELAICLPFVIIFVAGVVNWGIALREMQTVADAARQASRIAAQMNGDGSSVSCNEIRETAYRQAIHLLGQAKPTTQAELLAEEQRVTALWTISTNLEFASNDVRLIGNNNLSVITVEIKRKPNTGVCIFCSPEFFTKIPDGDGRNDMVWARSSFALEGDNRCA